MHENTGDGEGRDQMQNYEENFQLPTWKCIGVNNYYSGKQSLYKKMWVCSGKGAEEVCYSETLKRAGMVLCDRLATSWKRGCMRNWKIKLELMHCDDIQNWKTTQGGGGGFTRLQNRCVCNFITVWYKCIYISEKYMGLPESYKVSRKGM